jgi:hypothetical protein
MSMIHVPFPKHANLGLILRLFYAAWPDKNGRGKTTLLVEQVSHHPPITAYVIENKAKGLKLVGHNAQKTTFSGAYLHPLYTSFDRGLIFYLTRLLPFHRPHRPCTAGAIIVKQLGHAVLTINGTDNFLITLPRLRIDGLWYGSPYIELVDSSYIVGGGHSSVIEYKGKGYFSGKSHSFKATVSPLPGMGGNSIVPPTKSAQSSGGGWLGGWSGSGSKNASSSSLSGNKELVVEGTWHEASTWSSGPESGKKFHDVTPTTGANKEEAVPVGGADGGEMGEFETRKLWQEVAKGIREGDFDTASKEKSRIENDQRQRRKDEQAAGTAWPLKHFKHEDVDTLCAYPQSLSLGRLLMDSISDEQLGRPMKLTPPTDDRYEFLGNYPAALQA